MTTTESILTILKPLKPSTIPPESTIIEQAIAHIGSTDSWTTGKTFFGNVRTTYKRKAPGDGAPWHCRISEHPKDEISFDDLWAKLSVDKAENEKNYIHEISKVTKVKEVSPSAQIWTLYYTFTPPVSPRVFTVLQVVHFAEDSNGRRTGIVVTIPVDLTSPGDEDLLALEEKHATRGFYVSVERLLELEDGSTEWRMATSSTPGGSIPTFIVESTMPKKIASDIPQFLKWFKSLPSES